MTNRIAFLVAALGCALPQAHAQAAKPESAQAAATSAEKPFALMVGDKAPSITVAEWIKGTAVKSFEPGRVYVVEFWATWCGPCIASMPHLSQLQKEYADKGFTVIGVSSVDKKGNTLEAARAMVADKGDKMGYTVAWDTERKTSEAWMVAAGRRGIPCSFVVDKSGRVAFIGHPMTLDKPLAEIVAGKHDIEKLAASYREQVAREARVSEVQEVFGKAMQAEQWNDALQAAEDLMKVDEANFANYAGMKFDLLLSRMKNETVAYAFARQALDGAGKDASQLLNQMAWTIVDPDGNVAKRDLPLALALAVRANELTHGKSAAVLDTLARVHFAQGDIEKAVEVQTQAVALDKRLEKALAEYQAALEQKTRG